jgi:hypothetical protein
VGIKDKFFGSKREPQPVEIPAILQPDDPVNYNSVLDWLLGLSDKDYKTMLDVVQVYREAGKTTAKLLKIKDQPSTVLLPTAPSEEQVDAELDGLLETHPDDLKAAIMSEQPTDKPKKKQAPTAKVIKVTEK